VNSTSDIGIDFIEGHHIIPVSEMAPDHKTKPEEIALLCSNCHKMIHKRRPWLGMDQLKDLVKKNICAEAQRVCNGGAG
jgi:putative restriction endonuclease